LTQDKLQGQGVETPTLDGRVMAGQDFSVEVRVGCFDLRQQHGPCVISRGQGLGCELTG
jgi:hypothetical protein